MSIAWGDDPVPWETPVALATGSVPVLASMAPATVLNLNVPAVPLDLLSGVRHGTLGTAGLIRSVRQGQASGLANNPAVDTTGGAITLMLRGGQGSDPDAELAEVSPESDAGALADGWASLTPLVGVREDLSATGADALAKTLAALDRTARRP